MRRNHDGYLGTEMMRDPVRHETGGSIALDERGRANFLSTSASGGRSGSGSRGTPPAARSPTPTPAPKTVPALVDRNGQVVGYEKGTGLRESTRGLGGRWRMITSGADLIILGRVLDASEKPHAKSSAAQVALSGEIGAVNGLADIIGFIHQSRWTGTFHCIHEGSHRAIEFVDGDVVTARSNHPRDRLGELLYDHGLISRQDLELALAEKASDDRLGEVLVARGLISEADARDFLAKQVEEIFAAALELKEGSYCFERRRDPTGPLTSDPISTTQLLLDSTRRVDELQRFRAEIPSASSVLVRLVPHPETTSLDPEYRRVLALIDARRSVKDIAREARIGELEATRRLFHLLKAGFVELSRPKQPRLEVLTDEYPRTDPSDVLAALSDLLARLEGRLPEAMRVGAIREQVQALIKEQQERTAAIPKRGETKEPSSLTEDLAEFFAPAHEPRGG